MEITARINRIRYDVFRWRREVSIPKKLTLALGMAVLTGLLAQARFYIPWSPVPITGQTFAVLLAGILLGRGWGGTSLVFYVGLGVAGVPWFQGWASGIGYLAGPTGGYLIGFIFAALFLGHFTDNYIKSRNFLSMFFLMLFANFILIYVPGVVQLGLWLNLVRGDSVTFTGLLGMGVIPFIAGDITKAVIAATIARGVLPKQDYKRGENRGI
jgi:biotin transport system substrate-specific component